MFRSLRRLSGGLPCAFSRSTVGSIVDVRPIPQGIETSNPVPRRMAIIALDNGPWCFAWIVGRGRLMSGVRARFLSRDAGETYPTFTIAAGMA